MKKLFALLLALGLMAAMLTSAMAYEVVRPTEEQPGITHTLMLTSDDMTSLAYNIKYSFAVGAAEIVQPSGVFDKTKVVTGNPIIAPIEYTSEDQFSAENKSCTKSLVIKWSGVSIMEPGVYRWPVTKSVECKDTNGQPTNSKDKTYLYAFVTDNNGRLHVESVFLTTDSELNTVASKGDFEDNYPIKTLDLSISKKVTGNLGSKEQYFKFKVQLKAPNSVTTTHRITGIDEIVPITAYHDTKTNPNSVTLVNSEASVELWLKHGQTAKISGLLYGTSYTIVESENENEGYTVTSEITGDTTETKTEDATVSDTSLQLDTTVTFTNDKEATVPTGIVLESGAPIYGLLLAVGLAVVLFISKRKEKKA